MNKNQKIVLVTFAILLVIGGVIGFVKSRSPISLGMSLTFGLWLLALTGFSKKIKLAVPLATTTLLFLDSFFMYRYLKTWKLMPSGIFSVLTFIVIVLFLKLSDQSRNKVQRAP